LESLAPFSDGRDAASFDCCRCDGRRIVGVDVPTVFFLDVDVAMVLSLGVGFLWQTRMRVADIVARSLPSWLISAYLFEELLRAQSCRTPIGTVVEVF
jgi:hypothetical protein